MRSAVFALFCLAAQLRAQQFEVATVRLAPSDARGLGMSGGPGTTEPTRLRYSNVPLFRILRAAYGAMPYDFDGPSWMGDVRYDISANIPEGATPESFARMLQNLLAERFHLTMHRETREQTVYVLTINRGGPKLTDAAAPPPNSEFPPPIPGRPRVIRYSDGAGTTRMMGQLQTGDLIAQMLSNYIGAPVVNRTGLTGTYNFLLHFFGDDAPDNRGGLPSPDPPEGNPSPSIFSAIQNELGLRLDRSREPMPVYVIDRLDRIPTEN